MPELDVRYIVPDLYESQLEAVTNHPRWLAFTPNYPSPTALAPRRLTSQDLEDVLNGLKEGSPLTKVERTPNHPKPTLSLNDHMTLAFYNKGEATRCYVLDYEGQKMAVLMGGYGPQPEFPDDPKITVINYGIGKNYLTYSDLATYLCLPVRIGSDRGIGAQSSLVFQEWGGEKTIGSSYDPRMKLAAMRTRAYIRSRGYVVTPGTEEELNHTRHFLLTGGPFRLPAVIDIPCDQLKFA